ncbi:ABC transporter ATP-binding protein [Eubacteriales bacterium OttesenSCG-928-M02]|nr:ABC transporter ATP-binding protein [Eubacteriales bacterium OttesenSCG-928-M02]
MVVSIQNITKDYGHQRGIFDVSFGVQKGQAMGFLGPNGAGKTTTIRHLMGFIRPDDGAATINGMDCFSKAATIQRTLGYLPGEIAFMDHMTGRNFIRFIGRMKRVSSFSYAQELTALLELDASAKIKKMSKGTKQKIAIVCAFMADPDILLLDEPTSGLDPLMQDRFVELIHREKQKGKTILMSSHDFSEVERTCDAAVIIKQGRIVAQEDVSLLQKNRIREYTIHFQTDADAAAFCQMGFSASQSGPFVTVRQKEDINPLLKALSHFQIIHLDVKTQSLEQLFMHYYGGNGHV